MTTRERARHRRTPKASPAPAAARRASGPVARWMVLAALLGFAGGATAWWLSRPAAVPTTPPALDPAAALGLEAANAEAIRRLSAGRAFESLPYFRRQLALLEPAVWAAHKDFATALHNAAAQSGPDGPATRSSLERITLLRESLRQLDLAWTLTATEADQALLLADRAHTLWFWGMPWDALEALDRAASMSGGPPEFEQRARLRRAVMERPSKPDSPNSREHG